MSGKLSYKKVGVDIDVADAAKREMAESIDTGDVRVLNRLGAFASLVDGRFAGYEHPVLALKTEEPGSKQKLAFRYGYVDSLCHDLINHLINDIIVMGAEPVYVQDCIICGKIEPDVVKTLVSSMAEACKIQGCALVGGETSEQPGVVDLGLYILSASIVGVVDKDKIIDGSKIRTGDVVLAVASNGLHTNGYSLIRALIRENPDILKKKISGKSFLDLIMRPHKCYYNEIKGLFNNPGLHGIAHITGGGVKGNLNRILPVNCNAEIDLSKIKVLPIFEIIQEAGNISDEDMLRTYNMGVGLTIVCNSMDVFEIIEELVSQGCDCYEIGTIVDGEGRVEYRNKVSS